MAFKPNYNQQRRERARNKELKKQEKQQRREEAAAQRKAERGEGAEPSVGESPGDISPGTESPVDEPERS